MGTGFAALLAVELVAADAVLRNQVAPAEVVLASQVCRGGLEGWRVMVEDGEHEVTSLGQSWNAERKCYCVSDIESTYKTMFST